ncbi:MAG: hypothetical protein WBS14_11645 [Rhodomicrobium sp.]
MRVPAWQGIVAAAVIPERRSLIRDRNTLEHLPFLRSRLALRLAGMTNREAPGPPAGRIGGACLGRGRKPRHGAIVARLSHHAAPG